MTGAEIVVVVSAVTANGGLLLFLWTRVAKIWAEVEAIKGRVRALEGDSKKQYEWLEQTSKAVHATARNVVRLATKNGVQDLEPPD